MVAPSLRCRRAISTRIAMRSLASRLDSGSSSRNTCGCRTSARPSATRWRWPPDSAAGLRSSSASEFQRLRRLRHARGHRRLVVAAQLRGRRRGSRPRSCADTAHSSGTPSRCRDPSARTSLTTRSPMRSVPEVIDSSPAIIRNKRRLAAARRPDQHQQLAVGNAEAGVGHGHEIAAWIDLADVVEPDLRHVVSDHAVGAAMAAIPFAEHRGHAAPTLDTRALRLHCRGRLRYSAM